MKRSPLLATAAVLACTVIAQTGVAAAEDTPAPTPAASPLDGSPTASASASATGTATATASATASATATATATTTATTTPTPTPSATPTATTPPPVARTVSLYAAETLVALHHHTLHGTVRPKAPGPATVTVQRLVDGHWRLYKRDAADRWGHYSVGFTTNRPVGYVFRAVAAWTDHRHATSPRLTRHVVARPEVHVSGPLTRRSVPYSYRSGCPVTPHGLRKITINRFTYSHVVARGTLVVRASVVPAVLRVFRASFTARFPVRSMQPTDAFYAHGHRTPTQSDVAAMRADNTSAFNCRPVTGNPYRVSQHSYGNAIDINTVRNPYVVGSRVYPGFARTYLNRRHVRTGMITRRGVIARTMRHNGWPWGARWAHPDYQHFSSNGG